MSIANVARQLKALGLRRRFTLSLKVPLPDVAAREDILRAHLARHCREHTLGEGAVDDSLLQVRVLTTICLHVFAWHGVSPLLCSVWCIQRWGTANCFLLLKLSVTNFIDQEAGFIAE